MMRFKLNMLAIPALLVIGLLVGCAALSAPTPTVTPPPPTETATASPTGTATATATETLTLTPSVTPTETLTPTATATFTPTALPTTTPQPVASFLSDNSSLLDIPDNFRDGIDAPLVAFISQNDRETISNLSTAQPETNIVTLFYTTGTSSGGRTPIIEIRSRDADDFYVSPPGNSVAYLLVDPVGLRTGLYIIDLSLGLNVRVLNLQSLVQRGIFSAPDWSPDGRTLAIALATGYDMDIFLLEMGAMRWTNLTENGAYDWAPVWSPDGRKIAFLSDRAICGSWIPGQEGCKATTDAPTNAGNLFVMDVQTREVIQIGEERLVEPPEWITNNTLSFAVTNPDDILSEERHLFVADALSGQTTEIIVDGDTSPTYASESFSPDGTQVIFQRAGQVSEVILMTIDGEIIARTTELAFSRFAMQASWSADSTRIVMGGLGGQCPYGRVMIDVPLTRTNGRFQYTAPPGPPQAGSMCAPVFSPDGFQAAFMGVIARATGSVDGRTDVYTVNNNGFGQVNLTGDLRGQVRLLGWVGGQ